MEVVCPFLLFKKTIKKKSPQNSKPFEFVKDPFEVFLKEQGGGLESARQNNVGQNNQEKAIVRK